jgi:hypothetical protein
LGIVVVKGFLQLELVHDIQMRRGNVTNWVNASWSVKAGRFVHGGKRVPTATATKASSVPPDNIAAGVSTMTRTYSQTGVRDDSVRDDSVLRETP